MLDAFDKLMAPGEVGVKLDSASAEFAEHLFSLMEGKNKPIATLTTPTSYAELKKLFERILAAPYWTETPKEVAEPVVEIADEQTTAAGVVEEEHVAETVLCSGVEAMQFTNEQQQHQETSEQGSTKKVF